ncbi:hypothetical protein [Agarivorans sp. 1_MG-2023]|uniref:hypothetical protein n=1 Tax=Agarivorans sp. 1_MG-2023 TaxID=3062634 RepID=UPI0026E1632A|nr:hypothetical protein [Agarivorans sp. 1_MG-2023]MDO6762878.1 hypothetical protein [Agarivorans sp. 1_MG-2023]
MKGFSNIAGALTIVAAASLSTSVQAADTWTASIAIDGTTASAASGCSWNNWAYMTMGRERVLSCNGSTVARAFQNLAYNSCSLTVSNSDYKPSGSGCYRQVYKKEVVSVVQVYPGNSCTWVDTTSHYGYDFKHFTCANYGVVATKQIAYPWSYRSSGYGCSISAETGFRVTTSGTGTGDTNCNVTKVTK